MKWRGYSDFNCKDYDFHHMAEKSWRFLHPLCRCQKLCTMCSPYLEAWLKLIGLENAGYLLIRSLLYFHFSKIGVADLCFQNIAGRTTSQPGLDHSKQNKDNKQLAKRIKMQKGQQTRPGNWRVGGSNHFSKNKYRCRNPQVSPLPRRIFPQILP